MDVIDGIVYFPEYEYKGITGNVYTPFFRNGQWYVVSNASVSFLDFVYLCGIPEEEALILKLKFGSNGALQRHNDSI